MLGSYVTFGAMLVFIVAGIISALIYDGLSIFKTLTKNNILVVFICDFVSTILATLVFIVCIFKLMYGIFALFEVVSFVIGAVFEQIFVKNIFAKPFKFVYNKIVLRKQKSK